MSPRDKNYLLACASLTGGILGAAFFVGIFKGAPWIGLCFAMGTEFRTRGRQARRDNSAGTE
jgi:hypothetical protein